MKHAKLSPSSSSRWLTCTKSIEMEQAYPDNSNTASEWGTTVHEIGERLLKDEDVRVGDLINGTTIDEEMFDCALEYANYVRKFISDDSKVLIEECFDLSFIAPDTFGTGDATVLNDTTLHVFDLKTGRNKVLAEENTQLMLYALGALEKFPNEYIEDVVLHIVQTRIGVIDVWETNIDRLEEFKEFATEQATKILTGDTEYKPNDKACLWCKHKVNCEALREYTEEIIKGGFDSLDDVEVTKIKNFNIKRLLDNKELIISLLNAVEEEATTRLLNGEKIDGYKVVEKRTNRKWNDEDIDKIEAYLVRKLKKQGAYKQTLITPTQAVKKLDEKSKKYIEKFIVKPQGQPTVAPMSDKRPPLSATTEEFDDIS